MLLCAAMGLAVSVSLCFAQGNREAQLVTAAPEITTPFKCDSLDPKVCFDIYQRILQKSAPPTASRALNWSTKLEYLHYGPPLRHRASILWAWHTEPLLRHRAVGMAWHRAPERLPLERLALRRHAVGMAAVV
jgi:hypothetical protein